MTRSTEPDRSTLRTLRRFGSDLHFWTVGPANAPMVVFSHGAALDHTAFDHQVDELVGSGYRVVTWDLRGHGRSMPIGERFDVRIAADDLIAILDELSVGSATLVGHSFGGYVTQEAAFRHPDRVDAVVLVGCTDLSTPPSRAMRIARRVMPRVLPLLSISYFRKRTVQDLSISDDVKARAHVSAGRLSKRDFLQVILAGVEALGADAGYGDGYAIPVPVLLTHGAVDRANGGVLAKAAPRWAAKEPNATYATVPDAGHTANEDNPDAFNALLLDFLARHVP